MPKLNRAEAAYLMGVSTDTLRRWHLGMEAALELAERFAGDILA